MRELCWIVSPGARYVRVCQRLGVFDDSDAPRETDLCSYLLQDIYTEVKLPEEFLNELAIRFHEDGLIDVIGSTITGIVEEMSVIKFNENQRFVIIRAMTLLVQCKPIASIMPEMPNWIPVHNTPSGAIIEQQSLLGRFFTLSPLAPGVPKEFFREPKLMSRGDRLSMVTSFQEAVRQYHDALFKICSFIVKSSPQGRRGMLNWFSTVLALNQKRKALQVDPTTVATDGFMHNVVAVLNKFAEPFVDIQGKKVFHLSTNS